MKFFRFQNDKPLTAFAPQWDYIIGEDFLFENNQHSNLSYWSLVKDIILKKEKKIINSTEPSFTGVSDGYTGLGPNSLTSRFKRFNVFKWKETAITTLLEGVKNKYLKFLKVLTVPRRKVWIQCWANVMRKGEVIKPHIHGQGPYSYLGGHVCVTHNNTSTFYINSINQLNDPEVFESKNEIGKITLFQSCIPHYTSTNNSDSERITLAFDIVVDEDPFDKNNCVLLDIGK